MTRLVEVCFSTLPLSLGQYVNFFGVKKFWSGSSIYFLPMHLFITVMQTARKKCWGGLE